MAIVRTEGVKKTYFLGKTEVLALKGVDLTVEDGEFLAIAGPSGSGKTTLLNLIGCIEKPTLGKIFIEDTDTASLSSDRLAEIRAKKLSFIFQNFNLLPVLTALENVEYPLHNKKMPSIEKRERAKEALDKVGLLGFSGHKPMELSGGQRQRVAIARAIVGEPIMVLADESTANLDHKTGQEVLELMRKINQTQKTAFIFSTHDTKVMEMAQRIVNLYDGEIV